MSSSKNDYKVAVVGGGPVGLFLGICLQKAGISSCVIEKRAETITHSRSIGIHPVALEVFGEDLAAHFIEKGIKVTEGFAFWESQKIGTLSFDACPPPYPFILTLPQHETERLLAIYLNEINPSALKRNCEVTGMNEKDENVTLTILNNESQKEITAEYIAGCDGMNSFVRQSNKISFNGKAYNDTYIMGNFTDNTNLDNAAAVFLGRKGLVESFPLPGNERRWVVKTDQYFKEVKRSDIESHVKHRTDFRLSNAENCMLSSFRVFNKKAEAMVKGSIILAGDAAHVVSPIGGQGMNLGWLDAYEIARCFRQIYFEKAPPKKVLQNYSKRRLSAVRKASKRAAFNMAMGRKTIPFIKKALLKAVVNPPLSKIMARTFTMRKLFS